MRVLVIGGSGTIGAAVVKALHGHEVLSAHRGSGDLRVDITSVESIRQVFEKAGQVDGAHNGQVLDARKYA
jgi:nucleoside-diphosphate-sugar epimerase